MGKGLRPGRLAVFGAMMAGLGLSGALDNELLGEFPNGQGSFRKPTDEQLRFLGLYRDPGARAMWRRRMTRGLTAQELEFMRKKIAKEAQ